MVGLETAFPILYTTLIASGAISWKRAAAVMSTTPAEIGGYSNHGQPLVVGSTAQIALVDPQATMLVDRSKLASKSKNTPFHGMEFQGTVAATVFNGHLTHKVGNK
jgi:dihydroorotase